MAKEPPKLDEALDPVEAPTRIRTLVEATTDLTYGTKAEPTIYQIIRFLGEVLLPRRHTRPTKQ